MHQVTLGKTGITVNKNGFGALPIQRTEEKTAVEILKKAYDNGITFYDTARAYSDSEHKLSLAFSGMRDKIYIATKTTANTVEGFWKDLHTSLETLKTDYIDIYQFHTPPFCPKPDDGTGLYEAMLEAKQQGKIRFIAVTNHRLHVAREAVLSGLYDTLQFPFSYLSGDKEKELVALCQENNMGFLAMKALAGGLINNASAAYQFMLNYENVLPIWGIQHEKELDDFLACQRGAIQDGWEKVIEKDQKDLQGAFCRGCGYCMPCPQGIEINTCARMSLLIRRSPSMQHLTDNAQAMMNRIASCTECGKCKKQCPYELDTPQLLKDNLKDYLEIVAGKPL